MSSVNKRGNNYHTHTRNTTVGRDNCTRCKWLQVHRHVSTVLHNHARVLRDMSSHRQMLPTIEPTSLISDIHYRCSLRYACQLFWKFFLHVLNFCLYQRFFNPKLFRRSMIWKLKNLWPSLLRNVWIFVTYELVRISESIVNIPLRGGFRLNRQLIRLE